MLFLQIAQTPRILSTFRHRKQQGDHCACTQIVLACALGVHKTRCVFLARVCAMLVELWHFEGEAKVLEE